MKLALHRFICLHTACPAQTRIVTARLLEEAPGHFRPTNITTSTCPQLQSTTPCGDASQFQVHQEAPRLSSHARNHDTMPSLAREESMRQLLTIILSLLICLIGLVIIQSLDDAPPQPSAKRRKTSDHAKSPPTTDQNISDIRSLPVELLMHVFETFHAYKQSQNDLRCVCLVSKQMDAVARRYLYRAAIVHNVDVLAYLLRTLDEVHALGEHFKCLVLEVPFTLEDEKYRKPDVAVLASHPNYSHIYHVAAQALSSIASVSVLWRNRLRAEWVVLHDGEDQRRLTMSVKPHHRSLPGLKIWGGKENRFGASGICNMWTMEHKSHFVQFRNHRNPRNMEPLTALSLFCNIVDICDRAIKVCKASREIYRSATGRRAQDEELLKYVGELQEILNSVRLSSSKLNTGILYTSIVGPLDRLEAKSTAVRNTLDSFRTNKTNNRLSAVMATAKLIRAQSTQVQIAAISTQTDRLSKGQHDIQSALTTLETQLRSLDKGVSEIPGIVRKAKDISEEVRTKLCALSILGRLGSSNQRFWDVRDADSHTFHWILRNEDDSSLSSYEDDSSLSSHDDEQEPNRGGEETMSEWDKIEKLHDENTQRDVNTQLRTWLRDGSGLFHISGKPGSGKSTLMKYLVKHPKVIKSLEEWAHPKRLALGRFFFWKPDHGQNCLDALIRGLLYSVIHYDAALVHSAFPMCGRDSFEQLSLQSKVEMTKEDVWGAFNNIVKDGNISKMFKFCFFIDGLDELDEEKATTYCKIITILQQWADGAKGSLKICVSSRQFPVFENMPVDHRIQLQDLTKFDMINFVQNTLRLHHVLRSEMPVNTGQLQWLIRAIVERADGVFLWVSLVVKSVESGLWNGDPISVLHDRVKSTPLRLEELFRSLLDSIEDWHARMAVLLLALAMTRLDLSLFGCRQFFRAMETSESVSIDKIFHFDNYPEFFELTPETVKSTKSKLLFRCKGLLEVVPSHFKMDKYIGGRVTFLHRSISEFLKGWIPDHMNALGVRSLHVKNAMCWMLWAEVDFLNSAIHVRHFSVHDQVLTRYYIRDMADSIMANLKTHTAVVPEFSTAFQLLDRAEDALLMPAVSLSAESQTKNDGRRGDCTWNTMKIGASETGPEVLSPPCSSYAVPLLAAAEAGCHAYVRWNLAKTPPSAERANYFQHCLEIALPSSFNLGILRKGWVRDCMRVVKPLIQTSSADINGTSPGCCPSFFRGLVKVGAPPSIFDTLWLMALSHRDYTDTLFQQDFFRLIKSLLGLGAMPQSVLCLGTGRDWFKISPAPPDGHVGIQSDNVLEIPGCAGEPTHKHLRMICGQNDGIITLETLVAHARPPNMAAILSLIERNSHDEDVKSAGAREPTPTERLHAAVLEKHGVRRKCKLVWFGYG
ncbi:hypothetical protein LA080_013063 [Diaporthe eres]|nr:hypothetical protein LA080_013063 [Diaporthe eres]